MTFCHFCHERECLLSTHCGHCLPMLSAELKWHPHAIGVRLFWRARPRMELIVFATEDISSTLAPGLHDALRQCLAIAAGKGEGVVERCLEVRRERILQLAPSA